MSGALIFDFDGTLADTLPLVVDITYKITKAPRLSQGRLERLRQVPLLQAVRSLGGKPWDIPFLLLLTRRAMLPRMAEVPCFEGLAGVIRQLHQAGYQLYVLTASRPDMVHAFLAQHHLSPYFTAIRHTTVFTKGRGLRALIRKHHLSAHHSCYIGNEAADIEAAQGEGVRAIAVTWSGQDAAALARALPFAVVHKPTELLPLFTETN